MPGSPHLIANKTADNIDYDEVYNCVHGTDGMLVLFGKIMNIGHHLRKAYVKYIRMSGNIFI